MWSVQLSQVFLNACWVGQFQDACGPKNLASTNRKLLNTRVIRSEWMWLVQEEMLRYVHPVPQALFETCQEVPWVGNYAEEINRQFIELRYTVGVCLVFPCYGCSF